MKVYRGGKIKHRLEVPEVPDDKYFQSLEQDLKAIEDGFSDLSQKSDKAQSTEDKKAKKATSDQSRIISL